MTNRTNHTKFFVYLILIIFPIGAGLIFSFLYSIGSIGSISEAVTFQHWGKVISDTLFWQSFFYSVLIAVFSLTFSIFIAILFILFWIKKYNELPTFLYIPLSFPPIISAFLTFQFLGNSGLLSRLLVNLNLITGIDSFPILVNDNWYFGVIFTLIMTSFPYFSLLFYNIYQQEKIDQLLELGSTLGSDEKNLKYKVTIPIFLTKAKSSIAVWLIFMTSAYEVPLLLGSQSPPMLSILMSQKFKKFNILDIPQAYAMTVIFAIFIIGLIVFSVKRININLND